MASTSPPGRRARVLRALRAFLVVGAALDLAACVALGLTGAASGHGAPAFHPSGGPAALLAVAGIAWLAAYDIERYRSVVAWLAAAHVLAGAWTLAASAAWTGAALLALGGGQAALWRASR